MSSDCPAIHIGDAEREQVEAVLGQHVAVGRLTMSEFESRLDVVYAARTRGELGVVLTDLPSTEPTPVLTRPTRLPTARAVWTPWALTGAICLPLWVATSLAQGRPVDSPVWVIGPWGVVVLARVTGRGAHEAAYQLRWPPEGSLVTQDHRDSEVPVSFRFRCC